MTVKEARAELSAAEINDLPDSAFAYIEPGGTKDDEGKTVPRGKRHFPVHDKAHTQNALARMDSSPFGDKAKPKILAAAKKFGIEVDESKTSAGRAALELRRRRRGSMIRKLERRGMLLEMRAKPNGSGGTEFVFEGYGATFDEPFDMWDMWGDPYTEVVRQGAFSRSLGRQDLDVPFLIGHNDQGIPLARTRNGTMQLSQDSHGLHVRATMDGARSDVRDLASAVGRGDLDEMSIGFVTMGQEWSPDWETRAMTDLELHRGDVSAVALAANPSTAGSTMIALSSRRPGEKRMPTAPYTVHANEDNACPQCKSMNDRDAYFCDQCGAKMPGGPVGAAAAEMDGDETQQCQDCLCMNATDAKYCDQCGAELAGVTPWRSPGGGYAWTSQRPGEQRAARGEIADSSNQPDFNLPEDDPAANGAQAVKCPYTRKNGCGVMNPGGNKFCGSCGGPLYDGDGLMVLDDNGVVEEVGGDMADADLLMRTRMLELA